MAVCKSKIGRHGEGNRERVELEEREGGVRRERGKTPYPSCM